MDGSGDSTTPQTTQNLNELQSLLVNFNKEIEDQPILVQTSIDQPEQQQIYIESSNGSVTSGTVEIVSSAQAFTGFYTEQNILDSNPQDDIENQMSIVASAPVEVHSQDILQDSLSTQVQISTDSTVINEECLQPGHNISIEGFQSQDLAALQDASGGVLRIVSIGNDGQMHIIHEDQLQHGSEISSLSAEQLAENTIIDNRPTEEREANIIDGTDPVAVLASVAANTSSVSQLHSVHLNQGDIHNPQLVALQNSADSSQPQLVAVQNADGTSTEALQIIGGSDSTLSQALLSNANNSFQTVTLVPSETGPGGEVSYVLIMSSPDGDSVIDTKTISLDMSVYDFKEEGREITEEIVEEDGKTRRILRITPKSNFISTGQMMCSYCNYTSPKKYLLTRHMKTHSEERPHKCHICERGFKTMASLTNHVNTHTGIRPHKCKLCESAFTTSGELVRHVRYKHTFEKPHKCSVCEYASVELSKLKRHMRSHTGERPYACPNCSYASPDTYKLKRHLRIHTGEKPYECMICHARFTQSNSLKAHKLIHTGTKPVFQCEYCPTTCGRRTDLKIHVQKLHSSEHPLLCRKCGETLPDRYTYKIHIKTHEGEKCFKCDTCGHAALSQRHLDSHQLIHSGEKPFECESCDHSFRQKQLLKRHQSLHHSPNLDPSAPQETAHGCQDCPKSVANNGKLSHHPVAQSSVVGDTFEVDRSSESANSIITQNILEKNLMQEWRDGKLGNAQSVVIVHPDGTVEEVTHKLQGTQPVHIPHALQEHSSIEPDLSQIVIKTEPGSDEIPIVISAIEAHDQTYDETKEAATQAEIESDGDDTSKNCNKDNITDQSNIQFLKESVNIERLNDGTSEHMTLESIEDSTSSELHVHPSETELDISQTELDHSDTKFGQQRTELTQSETDLGLLNQSETEVDQIENKLDTAAAKLDQPEIEMDELEIDEPDIDELEIDQPEIDEPKTELDYSVEVESNDEQPLILDTVEHSEFIEFTDVSDIHPHDSESSYSSSNEMIKDETTLRSSMNRVETVKEILSPNRQTRSMKRKEQDYSKSPAKRTRKATADQN